MTSDTIQVQSAKGVLFVDEESFKLVKLLLETQVKNGHLVIHFDSMGKIAKIEKTEYYKP